MKISSSVPPSDQQANGGGVSTGAVVGTGVAIGTGKEVLMGGGVVVGTGKGAKECGVLGGVHEGGLIKGVSIVVCLFESKEEQADSKSAGSRIKKYLFFTYMIISYRTLAKKYLGS